MGREATDTGKKSKERDWQGRSCSCSLSLRKLLGLLRAPILCDRASSSTNAELWPESNQKSSQGSNTHTGVPGQGLSSHGSRRRPQQGPSCPVHPLSSQVVTLPSVSISLGVDYL